MALLATSIATDLIVTAKPTVSGTVGEIRYDWRANGLVILWRCSGGTTWVGRCLSPEMSYGLPGTAQCNGHQYFDLGTNQYYTAQNEGDTNWV